MINLTQHPATPEQLEAGIVDLPPETQARLRQLLTFEELPNEGDIRAVAWKVARLAGDAGAKQALIGGAPFLMAELEKALLAEGIEPVYAFSRRESVEEKLADGSVRKTAVFRHVGVVRPHQSRVEYDARRKVRQVGCPI